MVMSGTDERVVFVLDAPGDESLHTGGTIARLLADGAVVTVLFGGTDPAAADAATVATARTALGESDAGQWRVLPSAPDAAGRRTLLGAALTEAGATAVVTAAVDPVLRQAAVDAATEHGVPVFLGSRVSAAAGQRLTAIDVSDQIDRKLAALAAYNNRWRVDGRVLHGADGADVGVTGSETFVRSSTTTGTTTGTVAGFAEDDDEAPTVAMRLITTLVALIAGALFAVLGTTAHQTTVQIGSVSAPIGLVLALIASGTLLVGLRLVIRDRLVVLAAAIGLLVTVFLLSLRSTGGSVLIPQGALGLIWTITPALIAALVIAWPRIPARRPTA
jgi:predicted aconitase with swiveling domain